MDNLMNKIFSYGHLQNNNESTFSSETLIFTIQKHKTLNYAEIVQTSGKFIYQ